MSEIVKLQTARKVKACCEYAVYKGKDADMGCAVLGEPYGVCIFSDDILNKGKVDCVLKSESDWITQLFIELDGLR